MPVLWLSGPPGVGKTTAGWRLYRHLTRAGLAVGYVDIDQLSICSSGRGPLAERYAVAARNLTSLAACHRSAGARALVVSGVTDPYDPGYCSGIPGLVVTPLRLRADAHELARRLSARGQDQAVVDQALTEAAVLDATPTGGLCSETTDASAEQVFATILASAEDWLETLDLRLVEPPTPPPPPAADAAGQVLWLCGPTGVGKSAVGFDLYQRHVLGRGVAGAYIDLEQIAKFPPPTARGRDQLTARALASMWRTFHEAGARCLVVVGPAESEESIETHSRALPAAALTACRLHASRDTLIERLRRRGRGENWGQPGDPLLGQSDAHLLQVARRAAADDERLEQARLGHLRVDTDHLSVAEVADALHAIAGWPPTPPAS
ncbi:AAA domain-containing protein [Motilibacter peucedani]|uniref:AAA domain-containing protein n=1 Tax=Motilibacter peucedani TaxID=598650 RepID=A0A420XUP3_9ACTN|nr:AAA family ATPase [Motilibacter peucedani]RKS80573.1 AAA domain-containing protein [Motilibacter peucedani]